MYSSKSLVGSEILTTDTLKTKQTPPPPAPHGVLRGVERTLNQLKLNTLLLWASVVQRYEVRVKCCHWLPAPVLRGLRPWGRRGAPSYLLLFPTQEQYHHHVWLSSVAPKTYNPKLYSSCFNYKIHHWINENEVRFQEKRKAMRSCNICNAISIILYR